MSAEDLRYIARAPEQSSSLDFDVDLADVLEPLTPVPGPVTGPATLPTMHMYGRYEILGRLAFGGMAEIFLARESSSAGASRHIVIKRILPNVADDEKFVEMFLNEARLAIQLNHPNICHIYEFGDLEQSYFIAMEWIDGVSLGKLIRRARDEGRGMPLDIAVRIGAQVAEALHYAHLAKDALRRPMNIVHRDVTPHNVMIAYDGQVKLLDFGIAKAETQTEKTEAGAVKGKFSYMSPEQCTGKMIDGRSDVFALGICLWETLVGRSLYRRDTQYETMNAVIHEAPASMRKFRRGVPASLDAIVMKALAKEPGDRYQSAGEVQSALEGWLAQSRKVVNSTTIAGLMEELYAKEIQRGPRVESDDFNASFHRPKASGSVPLGEHASGSMSAAVPLSDPSAVAAMMPPEPVSKSKASKYAAFGLVALLAFVGAFIGFDTYLAGESNAPGDEVTTAGDPAGDDGEGRDEGLDDDPTGVEGEPGAGEVAHGQEGQEGQEVEAPPTPVQTHAIVEVTYAPARARVALDGNPVSGSSPLLIDAITPGPHRITIAAAGHLEFVQELDVVAGEHVDLTANLTPRPRGPAAPPGRISINTRPWSKVYVGSRLLGTTPIAEARLPSGAVRLRLVDRDGRTHTKNVRIPANGSERVFYDFNQ